MDYTPSTKYTSVFTAERARHNAELAAETMAIAEPAKDDTPEVEAVKVVISDVPKKRGRPAKNKG